MIKSPEIRTLFFLNKKEMNSKKHWDNAYDIRPTEELGWYEENPQPTIDLINQINPDKSVRFLNVGAGSSTLVDYLLSEGFENIIINDISSTAIEKLKARLGNLESKAEYIVDDLTNPDLLNQMAPVDIWYDRAVLHFFRDESDKQTYFNILKSKVKSGGYAIIAEFSLEGAEKCCDLELCRYDEKSISARLGDEFELINSFNHTFINPRGGERPYIYTLYRRL